MKQPCKADEEQDTDLNSNNDELETINCVLPFAHNFQKCDPKLGLAWEVPVSGWDYRHEPPYLARFPLEGALIYFQGGSHYVTLAIVKLTRQTRLALNSW